MIFSWEGRVSIYFSIAFSSCPGSNEEKWVVTEGRGSKVKRRKTPFEGVGGRGGEGMGGV